MNDLSTYIIENFFGIVLFIGYVVFTITLLVLKIIFKRKDSKERVELREYIDSVRNTAELNKIHIDQILYPNKVSDAMDEFVKNRGEDDDSVELGI